MLANLDGVGMTMARTGGAVAVALAACLNAACGGRSFYDFGMVNENDDGGGRATGGDGTGARPGGAGGAKQSPSAVAVGNAGQASGGGAGGQGGGGGRAGSSTSVLDGSFDPNQVYLAGTLSEGACYRDAIAHFSTPNDARTGFGCYAGSFALDPGSKRLVFRDDSGASAKLYAFEPDGDGVGLYPDDPYANDTLLPAFCENPGALFADPSGGSLVHQCQGSAPCTDHCLYYDTEGAVFEVPNAYRLAHRGFNGALLLREGASDGGWAISAADGTLRTLAIPSEPAAIRANAQGFWVLIEQARWSIGLDGSVTLDGQYPAPPPSSRSDGECSFDALGAIVCLGRSTDVVFEDQILRAELGAAEAKVVYTEASSPLVKIHISYLVTGP